MAVIYGYADTERRLLDSLPREVKSVEDIPKVHHAMKKEYDSMKTKGIMAKLRRWNKKRQITKIEQNKDSPLHRGAQGELRVLDRLADLNDDYYVLCGVSMELPNYVTYNGRRNLRSAQMDFIVVSRRGVILIEVKNWSSRYYNQNNNLSPHEQVDRAGRVLWISLKSWRSPTNPSITNVLLSVQGNMQYNPSYKFVNVKDLRNINHFIENRYEQFSEKDVKRIVGRIKNHVTK